jgi:hypothetical protein
MTWLLGRYSDAYASNQYQALQQFYAPPGFKSRSLRSPVRVEACSDFQLCG